MLDAGVQRLLAAVQVEDAAKVAVVVDRLLGDDARQHGLRIGGESVLGERVAARLGGRAFLQEPPGPGIEPRIGGELEAQSLVSHDQRLHEDEGRAGRGPDEGMAGRDHAGVGEARFGRDLMVAFDHHDLVAVPLQLIGGRDADHAAAQHCYAHDDFAFPVDRGAVPAAGSVCSAKIGVRRCFITQPLPAADGTKWPLSTSLRH